MTDILYLTVKDIMLLADTLRAFPPDTRLSVEILNNELHIVTSDMEVKNIVSINNGAVTSKN